ncbi:N-acetylmuramic acid 6-phosphate etherase [Wukongibacter baidiensis]|uniref:N-acetylmuramic acid 6-phosphate etherase n=1 Tax=Wukongibacter baidiensis TaxID=1723361 RepID=UPI003D7FE8E9
MNFNLNKLVTEKSNDSSKNIDTKDTIDILTIINDEDKTIAYAVEKQLPNIAQAVDMIVDAIDEKSGRLVYLGAGTSGRLGVLDASECPPTFNTPKELVVGMIAGGDTALRNAMEGVEDIPEEGVKDLKSINFSTKDVLVGIAASGRTPYVVGALKYAKEIGAKTISVTCNKDAEISKYADVAIEVVVGPEIVTGSTRMKAGTAQKMVLNMLTTASMINLGKTFKNYMIDVRPQNEKLKQRAKNMLMELSDISPQYAEELLEMTSWNVKEALVMAKTSLEYHEAKKLLKENRGRVYWAINSHCKLKGEE